MIRFDFMVTPEFSCNNLFVKVFNRLYNPIPRFLENRAIKRVCIQKYMLNREPRNELVVVSLTTTPARISIVEYAIKSLMLQTYKPDKIILWLSQEQFNNIELPQSLVELKQYGLEIRFCERDIRSHKKYYYAMKKFSDDFIVTYDDDIIYERKSLEKLMKFYKKFPNCVICNRGMHITVVDDEITDLRSWKAIATEGARGPSYNVMASTGSGCLYPPKVLDAKVFNLNNIMTYSLNTNDVWLKTMELISDVKVVKTSKNTRRLINIKDSQLENLSYENLINGAADCVLRKLIELYPDVKMKLGCRNKI